jgi:hypothetical protein
VFLENGLFVVALTPRAFSKQRVCYLLLFQASGDCNSCYGVINLLCMEVGHS